MGKVTVLCVAGALALAGVVQAQAMPAQFLASPSVSSPVTDVAACGPGTHIGPYGHYCWANKGAMVACPAGYHIGPKGHYCWPDNVSIPAHWANVCPPGYHVGPEGYRCWPG